MDMRTGTSVRSPKIAQNVYNKYKNHLLLLLLLSASHSHPRSTHVDTVCTLYGECDSLKCQHRIRRTADWRCLTLALRVFIFHFSIFVSAESVRIFGEMHIHFCGLHARDRHETSWAGRVRGPEHLRILMNEERPNHRK